MAARPANGNPGAKGAAEYAVNSLLDDAERSKGNALVEAWWQAMMDRSAMPLAKVGGNYYTGFPKWLHYQRYWAEETGIWTPAQGSTDDERKGASPELIALLDKRDELQKAADPVEVQDELNNVLKAIEKEQAKTSVSDPDSRQAKDARFAAALNALWGFMSKHVGRWCYGGNAFGYWPDYVPWMYPTPVTDGKHVYQIDGDHIFVGSLPKAPMDMVVVTRGENPLRLANNPIDRTYGSGIIEGDRIYIRGYHYVTCIGYTGDEVVNVDGQQYGWGPLYQTYLKVAGFKSWELDPAVFADIHRLRQVVDLNPVLAGQRGAVTVFLFTDLKSEVEQTLRFEQTEPGIRAWVGGKEVRHGERIRFAKGFCRLFLEVEVEAPPARGPFISPRFWASEDVKRETADWEAAVKRRRPYFEEAIRVDFDSVEAASARKLRAEAK